MKILLIDDDAAFLTLVSTAFENAGFTVFTASTGNAGLEQAKNQKPDFILCDQILPDLQGSEVLQSLKEDLDTKPIPIAILSNYNDAQLVQDALDKGAVDYILKYQNEPHELIVKINELYQKSQAAAAKPVVPGQQPAPEPTKPA